MIKKLLKVVSILLVLTLCVAGVFFYSIFVSVERLNVSYETITSDAIPASLHNVKIAFISDLEYNHFMDKQRLQKMINTINEAKPDVVIFGGDMFYSPSTNSIDEPIKQELAQLLESIDAPLGKFAVLGEQDHANEATLEMVKNILYTSNFELLDNTSIKLRNGTDESIYLVGLNSYINNAMDITKAFQDVDRNTFTILASHFPDSVLQKDFPTASIDLMFAGHSHSSQIYIPLIGSMSREPGAQTYNHGKHTVNGMLLHISNGLGTAELDMRLFSPPQMLVYRLQSGVLPVVPEVTPEPEPTPEQPPEEPIEEPKEDVVDTPVEENPPQESQEQGNNEDTNDTPNEDTPTQEPTE